MFSLFWAAFILTCACAISSSAQAQPMTFSGIVTQSNSQSGAIWGLESQVPIGTLFSGSFLYLASAPVLSSIVTPTGSETRYEGLAITVSFSTVGTIASPFSDVTVSNSAFVNLDQFVVHASVSNGITTQGLSDLAFRISVQLVDSSATRFDSSVLPTPGFSFQDFTSARFLATFLRNQGQPSEDAYFLNGRLDVIPSIPEPGPATLMLLGLLVMFALANRVVRPL